VRSYVHSCVSPPVVIEGNDSLTAEIVDGKVSVTVNAITYETFVNPWVGLYQTVEKDNRKWVLYTKLSGPRGTYSLKLPRAGEYEARLFANGSYDMLLRSSNTFTVPTPQKP